MYLRWKLAVVLGGGSGAGRAICLRLARAGAGVLVTAPDLPAAEATAAVARERRVSAWPLRVDPADDVDVELLAARTRDLGGADLLVAVRRPPSRAEAIARLVLPDLRLTEVTGSGDDDAVAAEVLTAVSAAEVGVAVVVPART